MGKYNWVICTITVSALCGSQRKIFFAISEQPGRHHVWPLWCDCTCLVDTVHGEGMPLNFWVHREEVEVALRGSTPRRNKGSFHKYSRCRLIQGESWKWWVNIKLVSLHSGDSSCFPNLFRMLMLCFFQRSLWTFYYLLSIYMLAFNYMNLQSFLHGQNPSIYTFHQLFRKLHFLYIYMS